MRYNMIRIGIIAFASMTLTACSDFLDVNDNPNSPIKENLSLSAKLPAALVTSAAYESTQLNQVGGFWGGYWGTSNEGVSSFTSLKNYNGPAIRDTRDGIAVWESSYNNLLYYKEVLDQANDEQALFYSGIAKIMMAHHFFTLVDFYNNVPYEEALKGSALLHPAYESGKEVYRKSMDLITEGIAEVKIASLKPSNDDVMFKGSEVKWAKFGNTLKLRALLRQSEVTDQAAYIKQEIAKIVQEGSGFLEEDAAVNPGFLNTATKMSPFYETYYRNNSGVAVANYANIRPSQYLISKYKEYNDPRLAQNYVAVNGDYKGVVFGNNAINDEFSAVNTSAFKGPNENASKPGGLVKAFSQSAVLLSLAEANFLQAEAAERGWIAGTASQLYQRGIQASFNYLFNAAHNIEDYISQPNVQYATATNKIERIITQKWLALNSINNIQAWADFRRLGYPNFPNSVSTPTPGAYPLRFMYPETEINTNNENVAKQGDNGILTARVWWDVN
ncbi:SusD/RagB family nutrient-binding outer membrane lipoprotein [Sphingobacterium sp. SYP-B4668]|uniref:SusD/RagB family nutrient-binding outer membrane lipoprotein n=1 Tax=Sphingobacterium sp. SYP-B4668 TaxID=2996035 RepID=UPI0022DCF851|nr:SusD/RagB family nutrient-binding outer membrane lipoprotein [Sphingobacterium sp. SYP-B4668]